MKVLSLGWSFAWRFIVLAGLLARGGGFLAGFVAWLDGGGHVEARSLGITFEVAAFLLAAALAAYDCRRLKLA